ncbi:MAG: hypothetical protein M3209_01460 [Acidobacteriota bacterium]|nr:hypothetical protein [Acidobacteriota bacterium]
MPENRRIVVNLEQPSPQQQSANATASTPTNQDPTQKKARRGGCGRILLILGGLLAVVLVIGAIGGYWWWSNLQKSPTYSLALLIDASRKDDQAKIDQFLDSNAVVDNFVPQIEAKAKERYARGFPPETVKRAEQLIGQYLTPVLPTIKEQARREIPRQIKSKTANLPELGTWATTTLINRVAEVTQTGDTATIKSNYENRPIELTMQKNGDKWKVVAVKDEPLADRIAQEIGQTVQQELSKKQGASRLPNRQTIEDLRRQLEGLTQP